MPSLRQIFERAKAAKRSLIENRARGEGEFNDLTAQYPNDGMIYFQRGEGYADIGELELALSDYRKALPRIVNTSKVNWKEIVQHAIGRVEKQLPRHKLPPLPSISDPSIITACKNAFDEEQEPRAALLACRVALERVVSYITAEKELAISTAGSLDEKIKNLKDVGVISKALASHMHIIRVLGNGVAHGEPAAVEDVQVARMALVAVLRGVLQ